jgi:hypothetical protein
MQESGDENPSNAPPTPSQDEYQISITVSPEGFEIDGEQVPDITTLVKHLLAIIHEHPVSGDAQEELKAGYESA